MDQKVSRPAPTPALIATLASVLASAGYWALFHGRDHYEDFQGLFPVILWLLLIALHVILGAIAFWSAWRASSRVLQGIVTVYFVGTFVLQTWVLLDYTGIDEGLVFAYQNNFDRRVVALHHTLEQTPIDLAKLKSQLDEGADADAWRGTWAIWKAWQQEDVGAMEVLLAHGAKPDRHSRSGTRYDDFKYWVDGPMERLLLQRDKRDTVLCLYVQRSPDQRRVADTRLLAALLEAGADPNQICRWREPVTPIGLATANSDADAIRVLQAAGASPATEEDRRFMGSRLSAAAYAGNTRLLDALTQLWPVDEHADAYTDAFVSAIEGHQPDVAIALLQAGATFDRPDAVVFVIKKGHVEGPLLRLLVEQGADPSFAPEREKAPLDYATSRKDLDLLQLLISLGADVNRTQHRDGLLHDTFKLPAELQVKFAARIIAAGGNLERRNSNDHTFLMNAAYGNNLAMAELALVSGADRNAVTKRGATAGMLALDNSASDAMLALLEVTQSRPKPDINDLVWAAQYKSPADVSALLDAGVDINAPDRSGVSALEAAARRDRVEVCRLLLSRGADANQSIRDGSPLFSANRASDAASVKRLRKLPTGADPAISLLASALLAAKLDIAAELIQAGAKTDAVAASGGDTLFHLIAQAGRQRPLSTQLLLARGVKPTIENAARYTPLTLAARHGAIDMIQALTASGMDVNVPDSAGRTAMAETLRAGAALEHLQMLVELGAKPSAADLAWAQANAAPPVMDVLKAD
jgi:ankyrin repeat protein